MSGARCVRRGFTMLELLVAMVVVGILASFAVPTLARVIERAQDETVKVSLLSVEDQADALRALELAYGYRSSDFPSSASAAAPGVHAGGGIRFLIAGYSSPSPDLVSVALSDVSAPAKHVSLAARSSSGNCVYLATTVWESPVLWVVRAPEACRADMADDPGVRHASAEAHFPSGVEMLGVTPPGAVQGDVVDGSGSTTDTSASPSPSPSPSPSSGSTSPTATAPILSCEVGYNFLVLSWGSVEGATGFEVYRDGLVVYSGTDLSWRWEDIHSVGGAFVVKALHPEGDVTSDEVSCSVDAMLTPSVSLKASSLTSVDVSWTASSVSTSFEVYRAIGDLGVYEHVATVTNPGGATTFQYSDTGLLGGALYKYRVVAAEPGGYTAAGLAEILL